MSSVKRWRDTEHLQRAAETAGGQESFDSAVAQMLDQARGWRLAELRKRREMTQEQVAARMGISVSRVSQIKAATSPPRTCSPATSPHSAERSNEPRRTRIRSRAR